MLREVVAERRAARQPPRPEQLRCWQAEVDLGADQLAYQQRTGAVAERRVAEALQAWATRPTSASSERTRWPAGRRGHATGRVRIAAAATTTAGEGQRTSRRGSRDKIQ